MQQYLLKYGYDAMVFSASDDEMAKITAARILKILGVSGGFIELYNLTTDTQLNGV
jgi:hypothetical protein